MKKSILSLVMAAAMLLMLCPSAFAAQDAPERMGSVTFSGLDQLAPNESVSQTVIETDGSEAVVTVRRIPSLLRAGGTVCLVSYSGIGSSVEFYMTVSNNKVTSVYDYSIELFGRSYDNPSLTHTSAYGKLTFDLKSFTGAISGTCWLKGTVTGSNNEYTVDWKM